MSKILMSTPIHECKRYALARWIDAISKFNHPFVQELFLVDNSPDMKFMEEVKPLLPKQFKSTIVHVEIPYTDPEERVATARTYIVKKILDEGFDFWFSWEMDTIAPPDALEKLLPFSEQFPVIHHLSPSRESPDDEQSNSFGLSLIRADVLKQFPFDKQWGNIDPSMPGCHHGADSWFNRRVMRAGYPLIEFSGFIRPIQHLND